MTRRNAVRTLAAAVLSLIAGATAGPLARERRRRRRRVRRRIRRRIRRRVFFRMAAGRRLLIVPVAAAAGWELVVEKEVVVIKEVRAVEKGGTPSEILVVVRTDGTEKEYAAAREDNKTNGADLEGSVLADDRKDVPGIESEVEEEVEEDP